MEERDWKTRKKKWREIRKHKEGVGKFYGTNTTQQRDRLETLMEILNGRMDKRIRDLKTLETLTQQVEAQERRILTLELKDERRDRNLPPALPDPVRTVKKPGIGKGRARTPRTRRDPLSPDEPLLTGDLRVRPSRASSINGGRDSMMGGA